ncbi:hypothetical protein GOP47_0022222 [Adiantum capillus-veneris]|uniref:Longin domain-containing protein n=1 Tax=Adiantum capillus-veneris TaxID=13818 RepID=A0A9D4U9J5_ADICA|nr:hypothetical protein GOP47_0022222 [Adiantum capillus-veneris]
MEPLVFYAAVAKRNIILADYQDGRWGDFVHIAARCLENVPPLHSRFSYTTSDRMFICLIEGIFIYCAIMDEALSKGKAFMFLEHVRDAFKVLLQQRVVHVDTLTPYYLHHEMDPFFRRLALPLVGMPQREKNRLKEEELLCQAQRDAENEYDVSSPSAVAPLKEMSDEDFDLQTERKPMSACSRSPRMPLIGKIKRGKNKTRDYDKGVVSSPIDSSCEALNRGKGLEIMIDDTSPCERAQTHKSGWHVAQDRWWRHVKLVIILDLLVCVVLLAIWLAVCRGVKCLKRD